MTDCVKKRVYTFCQAPLA